jgi:glycosyltransferase involved in cell wall biosynthesis
MKISVIVPTWKRPDKLKLALASLAKQSVPADQIISVVRDVDPEGQTVIDEFVISSGVEKIVVTEPGVIHAENSALKVAKGDIIAFLDDDAEAPENWVEGLKKHFEDESISGVGGPDIITGHYDPNYRKVVAQIGLLTWYGKIIGNHHHTCENILEVEVLKGVNMAFRRQNICLLDEELASEHHLGNGSHWELDLCLHAKRMGGRFIFDPKLEVLHHSNHDHFVKYANMRNNAHNMTYVLLKNLNFFHKLAFLGYVLILGNSQIMGIIRFGHELIKAGPKVAFLSYWSCLYGLIAGIRTYGVNLFCGKLKNQTLPVS